MTVMANLFWGLPFARVTTAPWCAGTCISRSGFLNLLRGMCAPTQCGVQHECHHTLVPVQKPELRPSHLQHGAKLMTLHFSERRVSTKGALRWKLLRRPSLGRLPRRTASRTEDWTSLMGGKSTSWDWGFHGGEYYDSGPLRCEAV
jgi:hypothetical protein